ncbi:prenylated RAB acceptor 1.H [Tasmannia lanceolata]|uniref:prenylated RAB acceptor 1.H n=1 Tax=Tasmannia lanceolata TaxID=3420 RepID=UPI0040634DBB
MTIFSANPLSLSVPDPAFETWLRDKGYLEILDERTTTLASPRRPVSTTTTTTTSHLFLFSWLSTLVSLLNQNPFAKLTADDFGGDTPSWTLTFLGPSLSCYSFPSGPSQARMRVHENVKRYARNYAFLSLLFFACSLYQMPIALFGLVSSLAFWELFRLCSNRWTLENYPIFRQALLRVLQFATAVTLYFSNVQIAFLFAIGISYAAMILHASLRKLTPSKQPTRVDGYKRSQRNR